MCVSLRFSYLKDAFKASRQFGVTENLHQSVSLYLCLFSWSSASWDSATGQMRIFYLPGMSCESICATALRLISRELHQIFTDLLYSNLRSWGPTFPPTDKHCKKAGCALHLCICSIRSGSDQSECHVPPSVVSVAQWMSVLRMMRVTVIECGVQPYLCLPVLSGTLKDKRLQKERNAKSWRQSGKSEERQLQQLKDQHTSYTEGLSWPTVHRRSQITLHQERDLSCWCTVGLYERRFSCQIRIPNM